MLRRTSLKLLGGATLVGGLGATVKQARQKLAQGTFSSELVTKLEGFAK